MKCCRFVAVALMSLLITLASIEAAGECGRVPIGQAAASLSPCLPATKNPRGKVPPVCCAKVGALIRTNPRCLCAVMLSPLAKKAGINPGMQSLFPNAVTSATAPLASDVDVTLFHEEFGCFWDQKDEEFLRLK